MGLSKFEVRKSKMVSSPKSTMLARFVGIEEIIGSALFRCAKFGLKWTLFSHLLILLLTGVYIPI